MRMATRLPLPNAIKQFTNIISTSLLVAVVDSPVLQTIVEYRNRTADCKCGATVCILSF